MAAPSPSTPGRKVSSAGSATSSRSIAIGMASERSPLQKLELELEHISNEEETAEVLYRRLTQRRHGRNASVISSRFEPPKRRTIVGVDGANDGPDIVSEEEENGIKATRFLTVPNPLRGHSLLGGDIHEHPVRIISPMVGQKQLRNQKVAHLTLEDLDLDHGVKISKEVPGEIAFLYEGESIGEAAAGSLDSPQDLLPKPEMLDGPTENPANAHSHRHQHDPEHPSSHHHPDHMQAPHTKEEREDALIMSYLRAIPGRKVPDRKAFTPPLSVRCGPLLRYCGMRRDIHESGQERETWRGSILIVTIDESSKYSPLPTARIFVVDSKNTGTSEVKDKKKGRSSRSKSRSGEGANKYREVEGLKLHTRRGHTFWRFNIEVELADAETKVAYRINKGPIITFWVPGNKQPMNIMFHSCNGFTLSVNPAEYNGPDPLWKDVLSKHQQRPFHVMLGGGDQVYNDSIAKDTRHFQAWLNIKVPFQKSAAEFTPEMADELEEFYFDRYCFWFSQGMFGVANAQIPMVNIWDDHDIIDGFGSYPNHFNRCPVFTGLGAVAFKYYMLFQHQSSLDEKEENEPSWLLGSGPGPYITELSRSIFTFLGRQIAFLGMDCRTERMKDCVVAPHTYEKIFARLRRELVPGETKHLLVLLGVPAAYPRLVWLENLLTSKIMDPIKALSRMGILGGLINNFDGGVELLDDLDDHWTAKNHKGERNFLIKSLQTIAAEMTVRITILSGDVHLAGIGQFMSNPRLNTPKLNDHRYMANIISSAIVNEPPPNTLADILNKRNKVHHLDEDTDEDMFPIFARDVDNAPRNNKRLMPRRNYCMLSLYDINRTSSLSLGTPDKKSSWSRRSKKGGIKKSQSIRSANSLPQNAVLDGAGDSREIMNFGSVMKDSLQVVLRVEINHKTPEGSTKPYRFIIPALESDKSDDIPKANVAKSI